MYTPLYIKTDNSLLTSMIKINDLVNYAKENNIKSLTITDNNMYGVMDFYHACINNGIKPIIGLEVRYKELVFILYAKNYDGYLDLVKISTDMSSNELVLFKSSNLICIIPFKSRELYNELSNLYDTYMGFKSEDERRRIEGKKVFINETLCLVKEDLEYLKYLYGIKNNKVLAGIEVEFVDNYLHLEDELRKYNTLDTNKEIGDKCNIEIKFNNDLLVKYDVDSPYDYLKKLCIEGLKKKFGNTISSKYQERLKYELEIINKMGFCNYFLVVWDYVKYAKEHGILVGPGRGSAAGSLVSYVLDITTVDPLKYNLLFERFLNPERITMPDIDVDFEATRRDDVVRYCINKYGKKKVAPIISFGTLGSKQAVRDVSRVMDINIKEVDALSKKMNSKLSLKENVSNVRDLLSINDELKKMYKIAMKFEGIKRHTSIHAAGIVMCNYDLDTIIPLDKSHDFYTTAYDMDYLEKIGLLKMDFLVLRNLTLIDNILKEIGDLSFDDIPNDDEKTLKVFYDVDTLGIFQFESEGMMNFLRKLKVSSFTDIYNSLALYRPGPMDNIDTFIKRREGKEKINYINASLEPILKSTYGIMVYQEQIIEIARVVANYTYGEADILRRAMSKKKEEVLIKEKDRFIEKSINNGYSREDATRIYDDILKFASYGFNKAHSVVYALISYRMAYLKAHYPSIFFKHLFDLVKSDDNKTKQYIFEAKKYGVNIVLPYINISDVNYKIDNNNLIYPLACIKGISINTANNIVNERNNGKYSDLFNFFERCHLTRNEYQNLILAGSLDEFGYTRKTLIQNLDVLENYGEVTTYLASEYALKPDLTIEDEYPNKELMMDELDLFGLYLTKHPVTEYRNKYKTVELINIPSYFDKFVNIIVMIDRINTTKTDKPTCFMTGSDEVGSIDLVLFNKVYEEYKLISKGDIVNVFGKVEKRFDKYQIIVNSMKVLE